MRKLVPFFLLLLLATSAHAACTGSSPTWTTTPDATSVNSCLSSAVAGDTINISAGSATWTGPNAVTISKGVTLVGAGTSSTLISLSGTTPVFVINRQASDNIRIKNISFTNSNTSEVTPHVININGTWPSGAAIIFQGDAFNVCGASMITSNIAGGLIIAQSSFVGCWDNALLTVKDLTHTASWTTADTLGTNDTTGLNNTYVEDTTFIGGSNGVVDCDDNCRIVWRHNTMGFSGQDGGGFNSHGWDSSPYGMRQFEIYGNTFAFPDHTCTNGNSSLSNINQFIWLRGGTGVVYNNSIASLYSSCWGDKAEVKISIRGAEDDRPQGACSSVSYPVPHQIGQNNNGTADFTDPVYFWNNTNAGGADPGGVWSIAVSAGWSDFGGGLNPCSATYQANGWGTNNADQWSHFFQWGRDAVNTTVGTNLCHDTGTNGCTVDGVSGTAKAGYTAFTYPHPLVSAASGPIIAFNPTPSINFNNVNTGTTSPAQTLTINNVGTSDEVLSTPYFTLDDSTHFAVTGGTCTNGGTIAASGSCTATVTCSPTVAGLLNSTMHVLGTVNADEGLTCNGVTPSVPPSSSGVIISTTNPPSTSTWTVNIKDCSLCTLKITCISGCKRNAQLTFSLQ